MTDDSSKQQVEHRPCDVCLKPMVHRDDHWYCPNCGNQIGIPAPPSNLKEKGKTCESAPSSLGTTSGSASSSTGGSGASTSSPSRPSASSSSGEPSNLTPPEPSDAEAIDRIAAYLRRNGYVEVTIWESGGAVYRRDHLHDALAQAERERDGAMRTSRELRRALEGRIDKLVAQLAEVTRERNEAQERLGEMFNRIESEQSARASLRAQLATATEAKERAERERDRANHVIEMYRADFAKQSPKFDAYHTIHQSLGFDDDTHPQEVVKAVARMRELAIAYCRDAAQSECFHCTDGWWRHRGPHKEAEQLVEWGVWEEQPPIAGNHYYRPIEQASLAAQRKEGEQATGVAAHNPDLQNLRPGQHVRFHPIIGGKHDGNTYVVRHANSDGVWLEGKPGMVAWSAVTPITEFAQQRKEGE